MTAGDNRRQRLQAKLDALGVSLAEADELRLKLERSLLLEDLWPGVFEHGSAKSQTVGNPYSGFVFTITAGNGEQRKFDLLDIPKDLWPVGVRDMPSRVRIRRRATL